MKKFFIFNFIYKLSSKLNNNYAFIIIIQKENKNQTKNIYSQILLY